MRRLLLFLMFTVCLAAGWTVTQIGRMRDVYLSICQLTQDHFYHQDARLAAWVKVCRQRAVRLPSLARVDHMMADVQDWMETMEVSHFQIYTPVEDRALWKGESVDSGIRARYVEDHLVIHRVMKGSGAEVAGLKAGDDILEIEGTDQVTPWGAAHRSGRFVVRRGERELRFQVASRAVVADLSPHLSDLGGGTWWLEIPSFRADFFVGRDWQATARQLSGALHVILDLRENSGGNFVAMLRAASTFHCAGKKIGRLIRPYAELPSKPAMDDKTEDLYQISELSRYRSVGLITFSNYGCFTGKVTVLVSEETSSTAEIFAESFFQRPNSRVWGLPTAGDVVLAVWYDLPALGPGYSVSIPEANYISPAGYELERRGVRPQRELHYDLDMSLRGVDSWLREAERN